MFNAAFMFGACILHLFFYGWQLRSRKGARSTLSTPFFGRWIRYFGWHGSKLAKNPEALGSMVFIRAHMKSILHKENSRYEIWLMREMNVTIHILYIYVYMYSYYYMYNVWLEYFPHNWNWQTVKDRTHTQQRFGNLWRQCSISWINLWMNLDSIMF